MLHRFVEIGTSRENRIPVLLFLVLLFTFGYFYQSGEHNENARFDQIRAIVERGELRINHFAHNTADIIHYEKNFYPNKAPGTSFVGVPAWVLSKVILSPFDLEETFAEHLVCYLTALFSVGLASALLGVILYLVLLQFESSRALALLVSLSYSLGTIAFPFSTLFFSHQLAAFFLFASFASIYWVVSHNLLEEQLALGRKVLLLGGVLLGYAVSTEYPSGIGLILISLYAFWRVVDKRQLIFFVLGVAAGGLPLVLYNFFAFGDIFFIPYSSYAESANSSFPDHGKGMMGVQLPSLDTLLQITFRLQRGLFPLNPWLLLMVPAFIYPFFAKQHRVELLLCAGMVISFMSFNAGYGTNIVYWGGGTSVGPRHILPMLPFAALLVAPLLRFRFVRWVFFPAAMYSVAVMLMATAVEPRVPYDYQNPIYEFFWSNYLQGNFALLHRGVFNAILVTENSIAFNLGKLFGLPGSVQLMPLLLVWLVSVLYMLRLASEDDGEGSVGSISVSFLPVACGISLSLLVLLSIPVARALHHRQLLSSGTGLVGKYVRGVIWESPNDSLDEVHYRPEDLMMERADPNINFRWDQTGMPFVGAFSVVWRGKLRVHAEGSHAFATESDDGSAVYINGQLVVNNWGNHGREHRRSNILLEPGEHEIVVRYYNSALGGAMTLLWQPPGEHMRPIEGDSLSPQQ